MRARRARSFLATLDWAHYRIFVISSCSGIFALFPLLIKTDGAYPQLTMKRAPFSAPAQRRSSSWSIARYGQPSPFTRSVVLCIGALLSFCMRLQSLEQRTGHRRRHSHSPFTTPRTPTSPASLSSRFTSHSLTLLFLAIQRSSLSSLSSSLRPTVRWASLGAGSG